MKMRHFFLTFKCCVTLSCRARKIQLVTFYFIVFLQFLPFQQKCVTCWHVFEGRELLSQKALDFSMISWELYRDQLTLYRSSLLCKHWLLELIPSWKKSKSLISAFLHKAKTSLQIINVASKGSPLKALQFIIRLIFKAVKC